MTHPAAAPSLPCPAMWPATPRTMAPLMHPLASAGETNASANRQAVAKTAAFMTFSEMTILQWIKSREGWPFPSKPRILVTLARAQPRLGFLGDWGAEPRRPAHLRADPMDQP